MALEYALRLSERDPADVRLILARISELLAWMNSVQAGEIAEFPVAKRS